MSFITEVMEEQSTAIHKLIQAHEAAIAELKLAFVEDLNSALTAVGIRKPADPYHLVGGQTHPTITKEFVAEELEYLIDKYETKPYKAMYGEDGNFLAWSTLQKEIEYRRTGVLFTIHHLSARTVKERGHALP